MFGLKEGKGIAKARSGGDGGGSASRPTGGETPVEGTSAKSVSTKSEWSPRSCASPRVSLTRVELPERGRGGAGRGAKLRPAEGGAKARPSGSTSLDPSLEAGYSSRVVPGRTLDEFEEVDLDTRSVVSVSSGKSSASAFKRPGEPVAWAAKRPSTGGLPSEVPITTLSRADVAATFATNKLRKECRNLELLQIVEMIRGAADSVDNISTVSRGLKGTCVRGLREAAMEVRVGMLEIASRLEHSKLTPEQGGVELQEARASARGWELRCRQLERERDMVLARCDGLQRELEVASTPKRGGRRRAEDTEEELGSASASEVREGPGSRPKKRTRRETGKDGPQGWDKYKEKVWEAHQSSALLGDVEALVNRVVSDRLGALERRILEALPPSGGSGDAADAKGLPEGDPGEGTSGAKKPGKGRKRERPERSKPDSSNVETGVENTSHPSGPVKSGAEEGWRTVESRRGKRAAKGAAAQPSKGPPSKGASKGTTPPGKESSGTSPPAVSKGPRLPRQPKSAAIVMTVPLGCETSYSAAMEKVTAKVSLEEAGVTEGLSFARARTGALMMRVRGKGGREKAVAIADRMKAVLEGSGVLVSTPSRKAEIRLRGLDICSSQESVRAALATAASCSVEEIRVGVIHRSPAAEGNGPGTCWARVPLTAAKKLAGEGRVRVGWTSARVEVLEQRPLQCFRCLRRGHTWTQCGHTDEASRIDRCYRCGDVGHRAATCDAAARCPLCSDLGQPAGHRLGTKACPSFQPGSKPGKKGRTGRAEKRAGPTPVDPPRPSVEGGKKVVV